MSKQEDEEKLKKVTDAMDSVFKSMEACFEDMNKTMDKILKDFPDENFKKTTIVVHKYPSIWEWLVSKFRKKGEEKK